MNKTKFFSSLLVGLLVTTGLFTSCKDYDDDIKNLQQQIDQKSLKTDLESLKSSLETRLATLESTLATKEAALKAELDKKADKTALDALTTTVNGKANQSDLTALAARVKAVEDLTAEIAGIKTKIATIEATLGTKADQSALDALKLVVDDKADKSALQKAYDELLAKIAENTQGDQADEQALQNAIATLTGKIDERLTEAQVKAIVDESAAAQTVALEALKSEIEGKLESLGLTKADIEKLTDVNNKIAAIEDALKAFTGAETIEEAKEKMQELAEKVNENVAAINILEAFVKKQLTSMVLMPSFYWEGLEAIEVPFAVEPVFTPAGKERTFTYTLQDAAAGQEGVAVKVMDYMTAKTDKAYCTETGAEDTNPADRYEIWANDGQSLTVAKLRTKDTNKNKLDTLVLSNGGIATYHYNPSTADLTGYEFSFFENDAEVYTRAAGAIGATPRTADITYENGTLTVPFDVKSPALKSMFTAWMKGNVNLNEDQNATTGTTNNAFGGGKKLPFLAAQMAKGDTVVTSDYGVVVPAEITIKALADNAALAQVEGTDGVTRPTLFNKKPTTTTHKVGENHLYETAGYNGAQYPKKEGGAQNYGAITMPATHVVAYDSIIKIDFIETHYDYKSYAKYGADKQEQVMDDAMMAALGLHYEYTLVDYTVGGNITGESVHMEQVDENGNSLSAADPTSPYFAPRSVTEDGKTITGKKATREAISREPLIRVDLKNKDGKIVRYGYVKIRIVETAEEVNDLEVTIKFPDMYFNCGDEAKVTWSQMENLILAKLGNNGLTKQEFEQKYYLDVVGLYENMPYINPGAVNVNDPAGPLYTDKWEARRYVKADGKYILAASVTTATNTTPADDPATWNDDIMDRQGNYTATSNWFGRVWYTPHDNATAGNNWDETTNVLIWNLEPKAEQNSNMAADKDFYALRDIVGATYESNGLSTKNFSTVVRFVNKSTGASIYVTLLFETGKLHFAKADINRRVLDHWYDFTQGYTDNTADTIEVYANVPTPAIRNNAALDKTMFSKDVTEYWLSSKIIPEIYEKDKFNKYWANNQFNGKISFRFRLPKIGDHVGTAASGGVNSSDTKTETGEIFIVKDNGSIGKVKDIKYWQAKGISGTTYNLYLAQQAEGSINTKIGKYNGENGNQIIAMWAVGNDNFASIVATIKAEDGTIHYLGDTEGEEERLLNDGHATPVKVNRAASDLLNLCGMYDETGKLMKDEYLDGQNGLNKKRAFTAYVEIAADAETCFDPLIGKNYFNVRFLRPVNMWPAETNWVDAPNKTMVYPIWKLAYIRDWRQYAVVPADKSQQFGAAAKAGYGEDGLVHTGDFEEGNVTYEFYGIEYLYVKRDEIRSDAYLAPADRQTAKTNAADIKALYKITEIPALTGTNTTAGEWQYLKIYHEVQASDAQIIAEFPDYNNMSEAEKKIAKAVVNEKVTAAAAGVASTGEKESSAITDYLAYTNNGGVVKPFHIYVPIALKYPWGNVIDWTQTVWAVITVDPTVGNE